MGGGGGVVGLAENKATQPGLAGAWAELGNIMIYTVYSNSAKEIQIQIFTTINSFFAFVVSPMNLLSSNPLKS